MTASEPLGTSPVQPEQRGDCQTRQPPGQTSIQKPIQKPELDDDTHRLVQKLFQLVRMGETEQVGRLLRMGLVPNLRDGKGDSLLMLASYHGHVELARLLLTYGGDPELANDRGQTPLQAVAFKGDDDMARALVEGGADVNGQGPDGKTAFMYAAMFDRVAMMDLLLAAGADPLCRTSDGLSAMDFAQRMGAEGAVRRLNQGF